MHGEAVSTVAVVRLRVPGLARAAGRAGTVLLFAALPLVVTLAILGRGFVHGPFLYDFRGGLYGAGHDIVRGHDPYRAGYLAREAVVKQAGGKAETVLSVPVYPAPALVAAVPFSLLPYRLAGVLFSLLSIGALLGALYLLGVRDWRCFGISFCCWPVLHGLMLGALTPLLVLGVAFAWRWRARLWPPGVAVALVVVAKLFPWPLALWLLVTGRRRALALSVVSASVVTLSAWAVLGFTGLADYPRMLGNLSFVEQGVGVSLGAALTALGLGALAAKALALGVASLVLGSAWRLVRRPDGEARAIGLALVAALAASPIVWPHYLALLLVPIALASPTLSPIWFAPLLTDLAPVAQTDGRPWAIIPYLALPALLAWRLCSSKPLAA